MSAMANWQIGLQIQVCNPAFQSRSPSNHDTRHVGGLFWPSRLAWLAAGHDEVLANVLVSPRHQTGNTFPPQGKTRDKGWAMPLPVLLCHCATEGPRRRPRDEGQEGP